VNTARSGWDKLNGAESALFVRCPAFPDRPPGPTLTAVTTAARGAGLWLALCAVEALRPGGDRRAARDTVVSILAALALAHLVKRSAPYRPRPEPPGGGARRWLPETPDSSAFPSAHAATSAAFTTAVAVRNPRLAALITPLTAAATYGRLRTRVHWPTDLCAGVALGAATAAVVRRLLPPA